MFGKPALVFAIMGYIISNQRPSKKDGNCYVELNPTLLASTFASDVNDVLAAIDILQSPDPASRSKESEGRRIVALEEIHTGPCQFQVVNGPKYREIRDEEERRSYLKEAKRRSRQAATSSTKLLTVNTGQHLSTQAEAEAEAEVGKEKVKKEKPRKRGPLSAKPSVSVEAADRIYEAYPKKANRLQGVKKIISALKKSDEAFLLEATRLFAAAWAGRDLQFCPYASTWFHQERYEDDPKTWVMPEDGRKVRAETEAAEQAVYIDPCNSQSPHFWKIKNLPEPTSEDFQAFAMKRERLLELKQKSKTII